MPEPGGRVGGSGGRPQVQVGLRRDGGPIANRCETNLKDRFVFAQDPFLRAAMRRNRGTRIDRRLPSGALWSIEWSPF